MNPSFSVYVHIPFCAQKCPYCDFNTYAVARAPEAEYVKAVCEEVASYANAEGLSGRKVRSVFFGGGTPSFFSPDSIAQIVETINQTFTIEPHAEITLEANPNHADPERLRGFHRAGINRLSFGVQSFNTEYLKLLGRDHSCEEARGAVFNAADSGFKDLSVDIIYGVPTQTVVDLEGDLEIACALPINHISAYSLTIEPGTPFFQRQERGLLQLPSDGVVSTMLERIPELLKRHGFKRYEISNYARNGGESEHNKVYWSGGDYLGVGAGAHSYLAHHNAAGFLESASRWSNLALPHTYIQGVAKVQAIALRESLDTKGLFFEFFYLGLRRTAGVGRAEFKERFGVEVPTRYLDVVSELSNEGFVECDNDRIRLSIKGIAVADSVFERLAGL